MARRWMEWKLWRLLGRWSNLEWRLLGLWWSVLHGWVWILPEERKRKRKRKERQERQGWWWKRRKARRWKRQVELCSTSDHISSCHTESTNSTSSLFFCSFKFWSWFLFIWNNWTSTCWCCRDRASTCWCFDIHVCSTRWTTTYSSWRTEPTWCKSTSKQERNEEDSLFWLEKLVHYDKVYNNVQL